MDCGPNGNCNEGNCICETGYTGNNCETEERSVFIGTFSVTDACNVGTFDYQIILSGSTDNILGVSILNIGDLNLTVGATTDGNSISISEQTVDGYTISGSGDIENEELSISYTLTNAAGQTLICDLTGQISQ